MHIENLRVGQWIVVTGYKQHKPKLPEHLADTMQMIPMLVQQPEPFNGTPIKIRAISPPFIVALSALNPNDICTVDTKCLNIALADKKYVQVFKDHYNFQLQRSKNSSLFNGPIVG